MSLIKFPQAKLLIVLEQNKARKREDENFIENEKERLKIKIYTKLIVVGITVVFSYNKPFKPQSRL